MKRSERIKAEHFFLKLWDQAVGTPGYNKEEWKDVQFAIWTDPEKDEIDVLVKGKLKS